MEPSRSSRKLSNPRGKQKTVAKTRFLKPNSEETKKTHVKSKKQDENKHGNKNKHTCETLPDLG